MRWIADASNAKHFAEPAAAVAAYLEERGATMPPIDEQFYPLLSFHEHLHSNVQTETMNTFLMFGCEEAESLRQAADTGPQFEAWLQQRYPALAALHHEELQHHPEYSHTVYAYLLRRVPMDMPTVAQQVLRDFVDRLEATTPRLPTAAAVDAAFDKHVRAYPWTDGRTHPDFADFYTKRLAGGTPKAYGVLYNLWKAYYLTGDERWNVLRDMAHEAANPRRTPGRDDFGSKL